MVSPAAGALCAAALSWYEAAAASTAAGTVRSVRGFVAIVI